MINQKSNSNIAHTTSNEVLYKNNKKRSEKSKPNLFARFVHNLFKVLLVFTISFVLISILTIIVVFHSPYTQLKDLYVTTAMTTKDHQWLARLFVSDKEIKKIMDENQLKDSTTNTKASEIKDKYKGSNDIQLIDIKGFSYKGRLLIVKDPSKVYVAATDGLNKFGMKVEAIVKSQNGSAGINAEPQITKGNGGLGIQPRTAIGQREDGAMLLLTIDGRQIGYSIGASLKDVQDIMLKYGAHNAANLDGGASTTLVLDDQVVNRPSSSAGPRYVPSAFIVKK